MGHKKETIDIRYPGLCDQWDYELNGDKKPENFLSGSKEKIWWKYSCGHTSNISIANRIRTILRTKEVNQKCSHCIYCENGAKYNLFTTEEYINKCIEKGLDEKYDFSETKYTGNRNHLNVKCKIHGLFSIMASSLLIGYGCPRCRDVIFDTQSFLEVAKKLHPDYEEYDYKLVKYINNKNKVKIIHKKCGKEFLQDPTFHIHYANGCPHCYSCVLPPITFDIFLQRSKETHKDEYEYFPETYMNHTTLTKIKHLKCGDEFWIMPHSFESGANCKRCRNESMKLTQDVFNTRMKNIYGDHSGLDWSEFVYKEYRDTGIMICKEHGKFEIKAARLLRDKASCPACDKTNQQEWITGEYLQELIDNKYTLIGRKIAQNFIHTKQYYIQFPERRIYVDYAIFDGDKLIAIVEYNGRQHYEVIHWNAKTPEENLNVFHEQNKRDKILRNYCEENNILLIEVDGRKCRFAEIKNSLLANDNIIKLSKRFK